MRTDRRLVSWLIGLLLLASMHSALAAAVDKSRAMDQFIRGTIADQVGDHYRAAFHYQEALRYDSLSAFLHVALAQDYLLLGNPELADAQLNYALRLEPNYVPALELKVGMLRGSGSESKSREYLKKLVELAPRDTRYKREMLGLALAQGDYEEAERLYQQIVKIEGESDQLIKQVLTVYLMNEQPRRALPLLEALYRRDSTDAAVMFSLGNTHMQIGDTTAGEQWMLRASRMEPSEARYWIGIGALALDRGQYRQAIAIADSGLQRAGENSGLYTVKGHALNRLDRITEAAAAYEHAVALDSTFVGAIGALALIYDRLDSLGRVEELYERAIRLSDSAAVYLNNLAYAYAQRAVKLTRAETLSTKALERDPKNASYLDTMGWIHYQLGHYDEAVRWIKKAVDGEPNNAEVSEHLGDAYAGQGETNKAQKWYRRAFELDPKNERLQKKLIR